MSVYPPLTPENLAELGRAVEAVDRLRDEFFWFEIPQTLQPGDEDKLTLAIGELRGHLSTLDQALFRIFGLVYHLRTSNLPSAPPPSPRRLPPTLDSLEDMLS